MSDFFGMGLYIVQGFYHSRWRISRVCSIEYGEDMFKKWKEEKERKKQELKDKWVLFDEITSGDY